MNIIIIGGGAAGFFAAIRCKEEYPQHSVALLEKESRVLKKVKISGGGRCNVTHACFQLKGPRPLTGYYPRGSKELLGPFYQFQPQDTMTWFEERGVRLKTEDDGRVFPMSDNSQTIIDCLMQAAHKAGVILRTQCAIEHIVHHAEKKQFTLILKTKETLSCDRLIMATGSSPKGYDWAKQLGHPIVDPVPSLFTFNIQSPKLIALSGVSVSCAAVHIAERRQSIQEGPLLITHWGLSGPAALKLSAWEARHLFENNYRVPLVVNWLGQRKFGELEHILKNYKDEHASQFVAKHSPFAEIPLRLWQYFVQKANISDAQKWNQFSKAMLLALVNILCADTYDIVGKGVFKEEFVTCGGVALDSVNFKTMESKHCPGLYFAGEILDVDGLTGGFNFQNAWTTGYVAGAHAGHCI